MEKNKSAIGLASGIGSAIFFGLMPLFTKTAYSHGWNAWTASFFRYFFGALVTLAILMVKDRSAVKLSKGQMIMIVPTAFAYATVPILLFGSYNYIATGLATTLNCIYPLFVLMFGIIFFKKRASRFQFICLALCLIGTFFLYTPGDKGNVTGIVMALLSAVGYGAYVSLSDNTELRDLEPLAVAFWLMLIASFFIGGVGLVLGKMDFSQSDSFGLMMIICLMLLPGVLGLTLCQLGIKCIGGVMTSLLGMLEPVTGVTIGILVFHEILNVRIGIGIAMILMSTLLLILSRRGEKHDRS